MGGLHGHIYHLYDNPYLTFGEIKDIFHRAVSGDLKETYEKIDGQNIVFSYNVSQDQLVFARNKTNIKQGGMTLSDIQEKWKNSPSVLNAYVGAYKTLESAMRALSEEEKEFIFGPNKNIWYSAEVVTVENPNVINYGKDAIVFHKSGFVFDETGNRIESADTEKNFQKLSDLVKKMKGQNTEWDMWRPLIVKLKKSKEVAHKHEEYLSKIMSKYGMSDSNTIRDFVESALIKHILPGYNLDDNLEKQFAKIFTADIGKKQKKKEIFELIDNEKEAKNLYSLVQGDTKIEKLLLKPLANLIHHFAVDILENTHSMLLANPNKEVERLKTVLRSELESLKDIGDENKLSKVKASLEKLKNIDNITSSMEGITFQYGGNTYKLTGNFAAINQILGLLRYG